MTILLYSHGEPAPMTLVSINDEYMVVTLPFDEPGGNPVITVTYKRPGTGSGIARS